MVLTLPGLAATGTGYAARRKEIGELTSSELTERLATMACALRTVDPEIIGRLADLPLAECVASPFALRAVAMGVAAGATSRHLELVEPVEHAAIRDAAIDEPAHHRWERGVLRVGKYQGFMADAPFATFDPSHISKWGPHEMLHRAAGFFFARDATRWEHYLGVRLNELVPVVAWYGPEQAMRLREGEFDRKSAGESPNACLDDALWIRGERPIEELAREGAAILQSGVLHFERELAAIDRELSGGRRVRVAHPYVDLSSDATAYVVGHFDRLRDRALGDVLTHVPRTIRCDDLGEYRDRIVAMFDALLFGTLEVDFNRHREQRGMREAWSVLHRAAMVGESAAASAAVDEMVRAPDRAIAKLREALPEERARVVTCDGGTDERMTLGPLVEGLRATFPCSMAVLGDTRAHAEAFARSEVHRTRASLAQRFGEYVDGVDALDATARDVLRLEAALVTVGCDELVERLCDEPDDASWEDGFVFASEAFTELTIGGEALGIHAAFHGAEESDELAASTWAVIVGGFSGDAVVVVVPPAIAEIFAGLGEARRVSELLAELDRPDASGWLRELVHAGALGFRARQRFFST